MSCKLASALFKLAGYIFKIAGIKFITADSLLHITKYRGFGLKCQLIAG